VLSESENMKLIRCNPVYRLYFVGSTP